MNCLDLRRALETDPADPRIVADSHLRTCAGCTAAYEAAQRFERALAGALAIDVPAHLAESVLLRQTTETARDRRRSGRLGTWRWAAAASLVVAIGAGSIFFAGRSEAEPFAREVATHVQHEPASLSAWTEIPATEVDAAFAAIPVRLAAAPDDVNYLSRCPMAGQTIVHMVMQRADGPVTVMYLPKRDASAPPRFEHAGLKGVSTPMGEGTLVLVASDTKDFGEIESEWRAAFGSAEVAAGSK